MTEKIFKSIKIYVNGKIKAILFYQFELVLKIKLSSIVKQITTKTTDD